MSIKAILFDLDGTLLPMDQAVFTKNYFKLLAQKVAPLGYEPQKLFNTIWTGIDAIIQSDGTQTNEALFWDKFVEIYGADKLNDKPIFNEFYKVEFENAREYCGYNPKAKQAIQIAKDKGLRLVIATNPIFPNAGIEKRIRWAGLNPTDFEFYTSYETFHYCKPSPHFYSEIVQRLNLHPDECLFIGNDVDEDMIATEIGLNIFLVTDSLINKDNKDISIYPHGNFDALLDFLSNM